MSKTYAVVIKPGSKKDSVQTQTDGSLLVTTTKPARDNQANLALVALVAKHLGVKKSQVIIKSGEKSRHKTILIIS